MGLCTLSVSFPEIGGCKPSSAISLPHCPVREAVLSCPCHIDLALQYFLPLVSAAKWASSSFPICLSAGSTAMSPTTPPTSLKPDTAPAVAPTVPTSGQPPAGSGAAVFSFVPSAVKTPGSTGSDPPPYSFATDASKQAQTPALTGAATFSFSSPSSKASITPASVGSTTTAPATSFPFGSVNFKPAADSSSGPSLSTAPAAQKSSFTPSASSVKVNLNEK